MSGGLPAARSTSNPASAAESEQVVLIFLMTFFWSSCPWPHVSSWRRCRAPLINIVDPCAINVTSIRCKIRLLRLELHCQNKEQQSLKTSKHHSGALEC